MNKINKFVGIDIASETLTATILTEPGEPTVTQTVSNSIEGFTSFLQWLSDHAVTPVGSLCCMEATGVYGESLCYFLSSKGYNVAVEPPLKVKRAFTISGHKTDAVDSTQIAEYAYRFLDEINLWKPTEAILEQIKVLLSAREHFVVQLTANTNTVKALQRKYIQTPIARQAYLDTIEQLKENIKEIERELKRLISQDPTFREMVSLMSSVTGVGLLLSSHLLVLTNGFTKPITAKQAAAHAGICPYQFTSGTSVHKRPRSRRHGPPILRKLLYLSALSIRTHNREFEHYFLRKVAEGKSKRLVINNIANKLLTIIFAVVESKKQFTHNYRSVNPSLLKCA